MRENSRMFYDNEEEEVDGRGITIDEAIDVFTRESIQTAVRTSEEPIKVILDSNFGADLCRELALDLTQAEHVEQVVRDMIEKGDIFATPHTEKVPGSKGKTYVRKVPRSPYVCLISG